MVGRCYPWQIRSVDGQKQEQVREDPSGNCLYLVWEDVQNAILSSYLTEFVKNVVFMTVKRSLKFDRDKVRIMSDKSSSGNCCFLLD